MRTIIAIAALALCAAATLALAQGEPIPLPENPSSLRPPVAPAPIPPEIAPQRPPAKEERAPADAGGKLDIPGAGPSPGVPQTPNPMPKGPGVND